MTTDADDRLKKAREYKEKNRDAILQRQREYNQRIASDPIRKQRKLRLNAESRARNAAKYKIYDRSRDAEKKRARVMVRHRIRSGALKRLPCEVCGEPKTHGHHDDYSKPLDVRWLCAKHHKEVHHANG